MPIVEEQPKTKTAAKDGKAKRRSRWGFPIPLFTRPVVTVLGAVGLAAAFASRRKRRRSRVAKDD
jgi:hypothetical protein